MNVNTPPQSLRWRSKVLVHAKLMGPYVYVLPRTPEDIAAAGGLRDPTDEAAAHTPICPKWDAPDGTPR
eukprot:12896671-Prorocentrum_lima.AAC.1